MVIGSFMDPRIIEPIFCFLSPKGKVKNVNSILEPVMIHQPASSFYEAQTGEVILEAEELQKLRETITRVYVQRTGKPIWVVSEDMERDVFMSATEAQAHGIVDLVAVQ
ncbi:BnaA06g19450D [Brassica napus]|uniref:BnaA06g19450D protein n=1 Tax=Brassica napus TaxID=3708 RepID=A0A078GVC7_BRANA|nr:BnaA06g19450D [Brassica napus]